MEIPKRKTLGTVERIEDEPVLKARKIPRESYSMPIQKQQYYEPRGVTEESSQQDSDSSIDFKEKHELLEGDSTPEYIEESKENKQIVARKIRLDCKTQGTDGNHQNDSETFTGEQSR